MTANTVAAAAVTAIVTAGDDATHLRLALQALAAGADVNAPYRTPRAHRLVRDTISRDRPAGASSPKRAAAAETAAAGARITATNESDSSVTAVTSHQAMQHHQQGHPTTASATSASTAAAAEEEEEQPDTPSSWSACGSVSVLHAAAASGNRLLLEFLLQNGASWQQTDAGGRSALHYALLHEAFDCAKQLLRRGCGQLAGLRDSKGQSAMDLCLAKGRVEDEELFLLLSG